MTPPFFCVHQGTNFLNTWSNSGGRTAEHIGDGLAFVQWLRLADLLDKNQHTFVLSQFTARQLNGVADKARTEREWARAWIRKLLSGVKSGYMNEAAHLNGLINLCRYTFALTGRPLLKGPTCGVERIACIDRPDALLGLVAEPLAHLIACEDLKLIKTCAAQDCNHWFVDTSKSHKRLYCSTTTCGNRAKVAAFRLRKFGQ
jgi:predicted RNA-binding Zn ribbon-like protein